MATSLGYVLMNWTSTFSQKKRKKKTQTKKPETKTETETVCCQTSGKISYWIEIILQSLAFSRDIYNIIHVTFERNCDKFGYI